MNRPLFLLIPFFSILLCSYNMLLSQVPYTVTYAVQSGNNDAEESLLNGSINLTSSDLELVQENTEQIIGIRFDGIQIPQRATINSAYIQFTTDETDDTPTSLNIVGELSSNAAAFSSTPFDISSRPKTNASVEWNDIPAWNTVGEAGENQRTPDLKDIVQEIVNQAEWAQGNALAMIIDGMGKRTAVSFNNDANLPAQLVINFNADEFIVEAFPFNKNGLWKYNDSGEDLGTDWIQIGYDDSAWAFGAGKFGYGDQNETTTLDFGSDPDNKIITYYFRKVFTVDEAESIEALSLDLLRDDGAVVYLNGQEILRENMPEGVIDFNTLAASTVSGEAENTYFNFTLENGLIDGENILAVEIHQREANSSDLGFDLSLAAGELPDFPLISQKDSWKYDTTLTDLGTSWKEPDFDDSNWPEGNGKLGYGDANNATVLSFGDDPDNKFITYYFRKTFTVEDPSLIGLLEMGLLRDDGAIVYINGQEVIRDNMPEGEVDFMTLSSSTVDGSDENRYFEFTIDAGVLQPGENTIAVEIHQRGPTSSDMGFDLFLNGVEAENPLVQLIHNSPDPQLLFVDVYVDAFSLGNFTKINGSTPVPFRLATGYLSDLPAGTHRIAISPFGQEDFAWSATEITLENNKRYIVMAEGVRDTTLFNTAINGRETIAFQFLINEVPSPEQVSDGEAYVLFHHASPDVPNIRIIAVGVGEATADFPEGLPYGFDIIGGGFDAFTYPRVQVTDNTSAIVFGDYKVDLIPFSGQVVTIFTSGFNSTEGNTGINEPNFGLFLAPPVEGFAIELPAPDPPLPGKIQWINGSPDPELAEVDVYLNGERVVSNLPFGESTEQLDIPAGTNRVAVAPSNAMEVDTAWSGQDLFVDFDLNVAIFRDQGQNYVAVLNGVRNPDDFPVIQDTTGYGFNVTTVLSRCNQEDFNPDEAELIAFNGIIGAPPVELILEGQIIPLVNNLAFGNFPPTYFSLPANDQYVLNLSDQEMNSARETSFDLDLRGAGDKVFTLLLSGEYDFTTTLPELPLFELYAIDCEGNINQLPVLVGVKDLQQLGVEFYPNPVADALTISTPESLDLVEIISMEGKVMQSLRNITSNSVIDVNGLAKGVYIFKVMNDRQVYTARFIKQ